MARPNQTHEQRERLIPIITAAFAELGYRGATTAELARRAGVRENILYRLWDDKKAMFLAALDYVYDSSEEIWLDVLAEHSGNESGSPGSQSGALGLLDYESEHLGKLGLYRLLFAGLCELEDPDIRETLAATYRKFFEFVRDRVVAHHEASSGPAESEASSAISPDLAAWAILGIGTMVNVSRELDLVDSDSRGKLLSEVAKQLLR